TFPSKYGEKTIIRQMLLWSHPLVSGSFADVHLSQLGLVLTTTWTSPGLARSTFAANSKPGLRTRRANKKLRSMFLLILRFEPNRAYVFKCSYRWTRRAAPHRDISDITRMRPHKELLMALITNFYVRNLVEISSDPFNQ